MLVSQEAGDVTSKATPTLAPLSRLGAAEDAEAGTRAAAAIGGPLFIGPPVTPDSNNQDNDSGGVLSSAGFGSIGIGGNAATHEYSGVGIIHNYSEFSSNSDDILVDYAQKVHGQTNHSTIGAWIADSLSVAQTNHSLNSDSATESIDLVVGSHMNTVGKAGAVRDHINNLKGDESVKSMNDSHEQDVSNDETGQGISHSWLKLAQWAEESVASEPSNGVFKVNAWIDLGDNSPPANSHEKMDIDNTSNDLTIVEEDSHRVRDEDESVKDSTSKSDRTHRKPEVSYGYKLDGSRNTLKK